jgi:hypothetical protein
MRKLISISFVLLLAAAQAWGADTTLYVNTDTGSGTTCSSGSPCASLSVAEAQIPADITTGGSQGIWTIECSGSAADTTGVVFSGTTTSATYYIEVKASSSYRHEGFYSTSKYRIETSGTGSTFEIAESYVRITGLQLYRSNLSADDVYIVKVTGYRSGVYIRYCLIRGNGGAWYDGGISADISTGGFYVYNNIIYDIGTGSVTSGILVNAADGTPTASIFNNTVIGKAAEVRYGIRRLDAALTAINNIVVNATTVFSGAFESASGNNATNESAMGYTGATGTGDRTSQTFTFTNGYHLDAADAGARTYGRSDPGSGLFSDDIDLVSRPSVWDIGADQVAVASSVRRRLVVIQ